MSQGTLLGPQVTAQDAQGTLQGSQMTLYELRTLCMVRRGLNKVSRGLRKVHNGLCFVNTRLCTYGLQGILQDSSGGSARHNLLREDEPRIFLYTFFIVKFIF